MKNYHRWLFSLLLGFLGGVIMCASDGDSRQKFADYFRHGLIGMGPAVASLKMTLSGDEEKANAAGA